MLFQDQQSMQRDLCPAENLILDLCPTENLILELSAISGVVKV